MQPPVTAARLLDQRLRLTGRQPRQHRYPAGEETAST